MIVSKGQRQVRDRQWNKGFTDGGTGGVPTPMPIDAYEDNYEGLMALYRDGYAAGQRALIARRLVRVRVAIQDRAAFSEPSA